MTALLKALLKALLNALLNALARAVAHRARRAAGVRHGALFLELGSWRLLTA